MPASFLEVPDPVVENRRMSRFISRFVSGDSRSRIYGTMAGMYSLVAVSWYFPLTITKIVAYENYFEHLRASEDAFQGPNSIALLKSQQTFQQTFQQMYL